MPPMPDFQGWRVSCISLHPLQQSLEVDRPIIYAGETNPLGLPQTTVLASIRRSPAILTADNHTETPSAVVIVSLPACPSPAADLLDRGRTSLDEGVGDLAPWSCHPPPHHQLVAVGIEVGGSGPR